MRVIRNLIGVLALLSPGFVFGQEIYPRDRAAFDARPENRIADEAAFFALLDRTNPALHATLAAADRADWPAAKAAWRAHLQNRKTPRWIYSRDDRAALITAIDQQFKSRDTLTAAGDRILARQFNLGGTDFSLALPGATPSDIPWDGRLPDGQQLSGSARQILNHLHHWVALGRAYWATGDDKYARDFARQVRTWVAANPIVDKRWMFSKDKPENPLKFYAFAPDASRYRSLCVGIRTPNMAESLELFIDSPAVDDETIFLLTRALAEHCRYLTTLSLVDKFRNGGNWQIIETQGLAQAAMLLPEFAESREWLATGLAILGDCLRVDTRDDGWQSEITPMYHGWTTAQYTQVLLLARRNGIAVPWDLARLERMYDVLPRLAAPDGTLPGLGDARTGNVRSAATTGALLYGRPDLRFLGGNALEERHLWLFGPQAADRYASLRPQPPTVESFFFSVARYCVFRSGWDKSSDLWGFFDAARWEGHSHNDALQLLIHAGTRPLLIDPGICDYSNPASVRLRQSSAHNVVLVGQPELPARADPTLLAFATSPLADVSAARLTSPAAPATRPDTDAWSHQRVVLFLRPGPTSDPKTPAWSRFGYFVVADFIDTASPRETTRFFQLPIAPATDHDGIVRTAFDTGPNLALRSGTSDPLAPERLTLTHPDIPTGPQTFAPAPKVELRHLARGPRVLWTVATPFADTAYLPAVTVLPESSPTTLVLRIEFPSGQRDTVTLRADTDGAKALVRRSGLVDGDAILPSAVSGASGVSVPRP